MLWSRPSRTRSRPTRLPERGRRTRLFLQLAPLLVLAILVGIAARGGGDDEAPSRDNSVLSGAITIDGATTLRQLTLVEAESFERETPRVRVTVGASGAENAMQTFCAGEVDIVEAARRMTPGERRACREEGVGPVPVEVGQQGVVLVVSTRNRFAACLTAKQLRRIWRPDSPVSSWAEIDPILPEKELDLVGPGTDTGLYELFAEVLFGPAPSTTRNNYSVPQGSIADAVAASPLSLGYTTLKEAELAEGSVRPLALDSGRGCVQPSERSVARGTYPLLSRPLFIYPSVESLRRSEVRAFIRAYIKDAPLIALAAGALPVADEVLARAREAIDASPVAADG
ncbi:MAG: hypothetical protein EXQ70_09395 [Solirubrobacterales bacterium]|nr:hypothetical protein [Solirubrobacterales bacterium]